jgi:hypothetical protein
VEVSPVSSMFTNPTEERKFSHAVSQTAEEMLRKKYEIGKGLGANLQGIKEPISLPGQKGRAGLGYMGDSRKGKTSKVREIPPIIQTFIRKNTTEEEKEPFEKGKSKMAGDVANPERPVSIPFIDWTGVDVTSFLSRINIKDTDVIMLEEQEDKQAIIKASSSRMTNWKAESLPDRREFW